MEDAKEAVLHQSEIVDESAPKIEKPQEHIIHSYCYRIPPGWNSE